MKVPLEHILSKYFFAYIDRGLQQSLTPLFLGIYGNASLRDAIAADLPQLDMSEINHLILCARQEVAL